MKGYIQKTMFKKTDKKRYKNYLYITKAFDFC